ncbi:MAG: hypothetical protein WD844_06590 [Thermoleophilaceae bacterium]
MVRRLVVLTALGGLAAMLGGGQGAAAGGPEADAARTRSVTVGDDFFRPRRITVSRRDTVRFVWRRTRHLHNVTARGRDSRTTRRRGYVFRRRFSRTTRLVCTVHPDTMRMTVRVRR